MSDNSYYSYYSDNNGGLTPTITGGSIQYDNKQKSIGQQNKEKILSCLLESYPAGQSTSELVKITGLHRDTIYTLCKDLTTNRGIVVKKEGKFGKYMLTAKALKEPRLSGLLLSKYEYDKIMSRHVPVNEIFHQICLMKNVCFLNL